MSVDFYRRNLMIGLVASSAALYLPRIYASLAVMTPATPTYAKSLNSVATLVMGYYGFLLSKGNERKPYLVSDSLVLSVSDEMRGELTGITINKAELSGDSNNGNLVFNVDATIQYQRNQQLYQQDISEAFTFNDLTPATIKSVERLSSGEVSAVVTNNTLNDLNYYQQRQWIYAWSALLNGSPTQSLTTADTAAIDYQLIVGKPRFDGRFSDGIDTQKSIVGNGQYLLREVKPLPTTNDEQPLVALYFDFTGQKDGTPVLANIEQTIRYQTVGTNQFKILSLVEKHLIPNPQPWQSILC